MIDEWLSVWNEKIRPELEGHRLTLNLICDVVDDETGALVVSSFLKEPESFLQACSIRLSHRRNKDLENLARKAVEVVTQDSSFHEESSGSSPSPYFRFSDLPREIRQEILNYTDLVRPFREVEWNAEQGLYSRYRFPRSWSKGCPLRTHGKFCNRQITYKSKIRNKIAPSYIGCWEKSYPNGCFCRAYHAAYSNVFQCSCWAAPTAFFLVGHEMRQDALQVFYTQNRFVVAPFGGETWYGIDSPPDRLPVSTFLTNVIPKEALHHLRFLEIVFPSFGMEQPCEYCPVRSPQWRDWVNTLENVKKHLNLSKLTMRAYFAFGHRAPMTVEQCFTILDNYIDTLAPLSNLRGIDRFFVHLTDPTIWFEDEEYDFPEDEFPATPRAEIERQIERLVMGSDYDAVAEGKNDLRESRWHEDEMRNALWRE